MEAQTYEIIGAAMEVHRELGNGFLEAVYQAALAIEFTERGVAFRGEVELPVYYKGRRLSCGYRADFVCFENILVETSDRRCDDRQPSPAPKPTQGDKAATWNSH